MPVKNIVKTYIENSHYHVYNRGFEGRSIFRDSQDYNRFIYYLKRYLIPQEQSIYEVRPRWRTDIISKIRLEVYCLMPNHFHLMVYQKDKDGITSFMRALMNSYVRYFNNKYQRNGGLFQTKFKAVLIENDSYLLHLSRYIHLNPLDLPGINTDSLKNWYSSYSEYIESRSCSWINIDTILNYFRSDLTLSRSKHVSYQSFVEDYITDNKYDLKELALE